jgi:hypothetical protein
MGFMLDVRSLIFKSNGIFNDAFPSSLIDFKGSLKQKTMERLGTWGTFLGSQHFRGVEGHVVVPGWD